MAARSEGGEGDGEGVGYEWVIRMDGVMKDSLMAVGGGRGGFVAICNAAIL